MNGIHRFVEYLKKAVQDEKQRVSLQFLFVYLAFAIISLGMTLVNVITNQNALTIETLVFGVVCIVDFAVAFGFKKFEKVERSVRVLFVIEFHALIVTFLLNGEPQGFSAIWAALFPALGMLLYRIKWGSIFSGTMFLILVFFFYVPAGRGMLPDVYTEAFMLRFPMYYAASFMLGLLFEGVRSFTQKELTKTKEKYRLSSITDPLTGLGNETAYFSYVDEISKKIEVLEKNFEYCVIMMDVNSVKITNDTYGHRFGCKLIVETGKTLPKIFPRGKLFHIGGDEFVCILYGKDLQNLPLYLEKFKETLEYSDIVFDGAHLELSVAIGTYVAEPGMMYREVMQKADIAMYENKKIIKEKYNLKSRIEK